MNASLCRMLGYSEAELLSMSVRDIHPAEEIPGILELIQARVEGRYHGHVVLPMLRKDGSIFFADIVSTPVKYNGRPCVAGFFRDVSELKRAEAP